jgi:hypothetical protein
VSTWLFVASVVDLLAWVCVLVGAWKAWRVADRDAALTRDVERRLSAVEKGLAASTSDDTMKKWGDRLQSLVSAGLCEHVALEESKCYAPHHGADAIHAMVRADLRHALEGLRLVQADRDAPSRRQRVIRVADDGRCQNRDCEPCPLGRTGASLRCTADELRGIEGITVDDSAVKNMVSFGSLACGQGFRARGEEWVKYDPAHAWVAGFEGKHNGVFLDTEEVEVTP